MKKFVVLFECWNYKHDHECMCYVVDVDDDFESILSVEKKGRKNGSKRVSTSNKI